MIWQFSEKITEVNVQWVHIPFCTRVHNEWATLPSKGLSRLHPLVHKVGDFPWDALTSKHTHSFNSGTEFVFDLP